MTVGMNVAEVRRMAEQLRHGAEQLRGIISTVDGRVAHSSWDGYDADEFREEWWPGHRQRILEAADRIQGLAQSATNNADEQERVSGTGVGTAGGHGTPSGLNAGFAVAAGLLGVAARSVAGRPWALNINGSGPTAAEAWRKFIKDPTVRLTAESGVQRVWGVGTSGGHIGRGCARLL